MMWWLIFAAPTALVAYELLDEDRRAVWVKRWARTRVRRSSSANPGTIRPPRAPTAVTPPRERPAALDTKIAIIVRRSGVDTSDWPGARAPTKCYTCGLLNREIAGPHEHPFEDLVAAERIERGLRPHRSKALWELVNRARGAAKRARASHLSLVEPAGLRDTQRPAPNRTTPTYRKDG